MRQEENPNSAPLIIAGDYYELEIIPGLAEFAVAELQARTHHAARVLPQRREDRVPFHYAQDVRPLLDLRRTVAVHSVKHLPIPRPKALLGHENFHTLLDLIETILQIRPQDTFETFYVSAAGSDSSVFTRIKNELEAHTGLRSVEEAGDLLLAVRRPPAPTSQQRNAERRGRKRGWEVVLRLTSRPLSTRDWRVCDMPGALNATVASTMMDLTGPHESDCVVNLACGSGTLLIERLALGPVSKAIGGDVARDALACAQENLAASGDADAVTLIHTDAGRMPLPDGCATTACVDLPFGMLVGSHETNEELYPRLLREAARLVTQQGTLIAITQEVRLFERVMARQKDVWMLQRTAPIKLPANTRDGYIRPRIYLLERR